jgi:hypothetical protein
MSPGGSEDRAIADLKVEHNGETYFWKRYVPATVTDLTQWLVDLEGSIAAEIDYKLAQWEALEPKVREIEDPITGEITQYHIDKAEIVSPDYPDYYALRRDKYPPVGEQLGATFKGVGSSEFIAMQEAVAAVKELYPKPAYL